VKLSEIKVKVLQHKKRKERIEYLTMGLNLSYLIFIHKRDSAAIFLRSLVQVI